MRTWLVQGNPLTFYVIQLVLNLSWPLTFFKAKKLQTAAVVNVGAPGIGCWGSLVQASELLRASPLRSG